MAGRPVTNKSNYWSKHHHGMLVVLARAIQRQFPLANLDIEELMNVGWYAQARYYKNVKGKSYRIRREMFNWVKRELRRRPPLLDESLISHVRYVF